MNIQFGKYKFLLLIGSCFGSSFISAQRPVKTVNVKDQTDFTFRFDKTVIERDYLSNSLALDRLDTLFASLPASNAIDSIVVSASASPEGYYQYNINLAHKRAEAIKRFLLWKYPYLDESKIKTYSTGENWNGLTDLIKNDRDIRQKESVIRIITTTDCPLEREKQLRLLNGGSVWNIIQTKYLKHLRTGATCVVHFRKLPARSPELTADLSMEVTSPIRPKTDAITAPPLSGIVLYKPLFAVKSNLLADAATFVNIEVEVPIGTKWSVGAEWMFPWWIFDNNRYYNQLLLGTLEGKYWFHTRKQNEVLSGHAIGIYVSSGYYDFQWKKTGYQGEIIPSAGISYTYAHKIAQHFRMEYSAGFGILNTKYRKYTTNNNYDQFPWLSSGRTLWLGPTKAEISFVWLISKRIHNER